MLDHKWFRVLKNRRNLDDDCEPTPIGGQDRFFLVEAINKDTSVEESLLIYDCTSCQEDFDYPGFLSALESTNDPYPVAVFKNWDQERKKYWAYYEQLRTGAEKKVFSNWFDKKISIYTDCGEEIVLKTDSDGINYLEYPSRCDGYVPFLNGRIYNLSFFELKKLFNVTGAHLFIDNVRYGLKRHSTGETLKAKFREYLSIAIYKKAVERQMPESQIETLKEILDIDSGGGISLEEILSGKSSALPLPQNFWFYHNGISIYSYETTLQTPSDQIRLCPDKVSVINGAQTLTNFFLEVESIQRTLEKALDDAAGPFSPAELMDLIIKEIFVKTVIIYGANRFVRPITHGLNTQIPILEESLLADSNISDEINRLLAEASQADSGADATKIKILKDGEVWAGDRGMNILDLAKHWLTIQGQPGRSKNFSKKNLMGLLEEIQAQLRADLEGNKAKLMILFQAYQWWDDSRNARRGDPAESPALQAIWKYGRNYFGTYVVNAVTSRQELDESKLALLYEQFKKDLLATELDIDLGAFKRDTLSKVMLEKLCSRNDFSEQQLKPVFPADMPEKLKDLLSGHDQSAYTFSKTIANYLLTNNIALDYFRVISRTKGRCKEAFPFPNSTFTEIVDVTDGIYPEFQDSAFRKAVQRRFPVFVINKDIADGKNLVSGVRIVEDFSFEAYVEDAKQVYDETVQAFKIGDESRFPRSSSNMKFHVRPKAVNGEDTFQFTNGDHITKRTFWANKETVDALIDSKLQIQG